jgi:hypothetical protein
MNIGIALCLATSFNLLSSVNAFGDPSSALAEFARGDLVKFSASGHPKGKGASFSLKHPKSWIAKEGDRPNIVPKFISDDGSGIAMMAITVRSFPVPPGSEPSAADLKKIFDPDSQKSLIPNGATFIEAKTTQIDGRLAGIMETSQQAESAGGKVDLRMFEVSFFDGGLLVMLQFTVSSIPPAKVVDLEQSMAEYKPLFLLIANSIVVESRWRK